TWRVVTTSHLTADRVAQLLGGHVEQSPRRDGIEILTTSSEVSILLSGANALYIDWQRDDGSTCDGVAEVNRQPCICPVALEQRRGAAQLRDGGRAPRPGRLVFRGG